MQEQQSPFKPKEIKVGSKCNDANLNDFQIEKTNSNISIKSYVFNLLNHNIQNLKVYVGQNTNPWCQYCQHMKNSLTIMKKKGFKV